jgi:UDP-N-acetylglucosamine acyltransferase
MIHHTAIIGPNVQIGKNVYIGPYCVIGMPPETRGQLGGSGAGVIIGEDTIITGMVTIDAGMNRPTRIGNDCFIMKHAHVGHDAWIEDDVTISCGAKIGGHARVMEKANIGLNACIHQWQVIGTYAMIGMGAVIPKRLMVEPYSTYVGSPARKVGPNKKAKLDPAYQMLEIDITPYD